MLQIQSFLFCKSASTSKQKNSWAGLSTTELPKKKPLFEKLVSEKALYDFNILRVVVKALVLL